MIYKKRDIMKRFTSVVIFLISFDSRKTYIDVVYYISIIILNMERWPSPVEGARLEIHPVSCPDNAGNP